MSVTKRCSVCGRFRHYDEQDLYCVVCGHDALDSECECGRAFDYAMDDRNQGATLHCPRCGKSLRGRAADYDA
jgi:hypothetical protein